MFSIISLNVAHAETHSRFPTDNRSGGRERSLLLLLVIFDKKIHWWNSTHVLKARLFYPILMVPFLTHICHSQLHTSVPIMEISDLPDLIITNDGVLAGVHGTHGQVALHIRHC